MLTLKKVFNERMKRNRFTNCLSSAFTDVETLGYATANRPHADVRDVNQSPVR